VKAAPNLELTRTINIRSTHCSGPGAQQRLFSQDSEKLLNRAACAQAPHSAAPSACSLQKALREGIVHGRAPDITDTRAPSSSEIDLAGVRDLAGVVDHWRKYAPFASTTGICSAGGQP
jgi:hypothetical protein